jgi:hypothetical protein
MVENPFFLYFIRLITELCYPIFQNPVLNEHQRQKDIEKETIRKSRSQITISFDTWTAPFAKKHVINLIAHFVDEKRTGSGDISA